MKELPHTFSKLGWTYTQVIREGMVALYHRRDDNGVDDYEVIQVQSHDGREIHGNVYPPAEYYPGSASWGRLGWTCRTKESALAKFREWRERAAALKQEEMFT